MTFELLHITAVISSAAYLTGMVLYLRQSSFARQAFIAGFFAHALSLAAVSLEGRVLTSPFSVSFVALLVAGGFLLFERSRNLAALGIFISPLVLLLQLSSSALFHGERPAVESTGVLLWLHVLFALAGNVLFLSSFAVSLALIIQERLLKQKRFSSFQQRLPSLRMLDRWNSFFLAAGLFLMTLGVGLGFFFALGAEMSMLEFDPRLLSSAATLLLYAAIVSARYSHNVRGMRGAWLSVTGFGVLLVSFVALNVFGGTFHVY